MRQIRYKVDLEGYCVRTKKGTEGKIGDTGKTGTGMSEQHQEVQRDT